MIRSGFEWYDRVLQRYPIPYESQVVATNLGPTHVLASGRRDAQPLVLIHGGNDTALGWINQVGTLSAHFRVYAIDLPGHPGKSVARQLRSYGNCTAGWMAQTLDGLKLQQANVLGLSLGGWVALKFAARHPARISRLGLLVPMGLVRPRLRTLLSYVLWSVVPDRWGRDRLKRAMAARPLDPTYMGYLAEASRHQNRFTVAYPSLIDDESLRQLTMPVLLVVGASDFFCDPTAVIARVRRTLPGSRIEQLPECNHLLLNDQPALTMQAILSFFGV